LWLQEVKLVEKCRNVQEDDGAKECEKRRVLMREGM